MGWMAGICRVQQALGGGPGEVSKKGRSHLLSPHVNPNLRLHCVIMTQQVDADFGSISAG